MIIKRQILSKISEFLPRKEYLAIVGPRQAGKTTLLKLIADYLIEQKGVFKDAIHQFTFEDPAILMSFEREPVRFIADAIGREKISYIFIDEFQYARDAGKKLKLIYDTVPQVKIIVTGSSSLDLRANVGKYMVGRLISFELNPFNLQEFLSAHAESRLLHIYQEANTVLLDAIGDNKTVEFAQKLDAYELQFIQLLEDYCLWGAYPAVVLAKKSDEKQRLLKNIYSTYVLRDVKGLLALATDRELLKLSEYLAAQTGNLLVYKNLSNIAGLEFRSLKRHLYILEETFIVSLLRPYFRNKQKELSKNPKIYFKDLGLRNYLVNNFNPFAKRSDSGAIIENFVFMRLQEIFEARGRINFWRAKSDAEVDFVIERQGEALPMEVKYSGFSEPKVSRSLMSFINHYQPKQAVVLNKNFWGSRQVGHTQILFAPLYYL